MATAVVALVVVAVLLLAIAGGLAARTGVPVGASVLGSDAGRAAGPMLEDPVTGIRGRPDYLLRERGRGRIYPVEVKPTRTSPTLYDADALQLAAYMVVTEASYGRQFAGYGVVRYASREFRVPLTPELRRRCLAAAAGVRAARAAANVHRSHENPARCRGCAMRGRCGEELSR